MTTEITKVAPPALPAPVPEYRQVEQGVYTNVLRLFFNRLTNLTSQLVDGRHNPMVHIPGGYVAGTTYAKGDEVADGVNLSEALIDGATEYPFVSPTGDPFFPYQGTLSTLQAIAKQILFGTRYTPASNGYISGVRIDTTVGNHYDVYLVTEPLSANPVYELFQSFTASVDGWTEISATTTIVAAGATFDIIAIVYEPDPTPTILTLNYTYLTPQNIAIPAGGEISHGRSSPDVMRVNKSDNFAATLPLLSVGDQIDGAGINWSIQSVTDNTTFWTYIVAPATTGAAGTQDFNFETVTPTPITVGYDLDYWAINPPTNGTIQGLYVADGDHASAVASTDAYGVDALFQHAYIPTEWAVKIYSGGGSNVAQARIEERITGDYTVPTAPPQGVTILCDNTTPITVSLPPALKGLEVTVIRGNTGSVTIDGAGATILGQTTQKLPSRYDAADLIGTDSAEWFLT
jgi:hypothetical protein